GPGRAEKEASALLNGSPCAAALLSDAALRARHRVGVMARVLALATDAAGLPEEAWDPALARASRDRWMGPAFATLAALRQGAARPRRAWQPPVSFRIAPQLLAAAMRAADQAASAAADWLATVTDNPTFFTDEPAYEAGRVLTNGGFHNPVATPHLATLAFVSADLATLAGRLVTKLHDERVTGLTNALAPAGTKLSTQRLRAVQMWFTERARDAAQPAFIPASDGGVLQSDIFLPAFPAYDKEETAADACLGAFACLAATASQALWADGDRAPAPPLRPALAAVRAVFPPVDTVRDQGAALARLIAALQEACLGNRPELAGNHAADRPFASHSPAPEPDDGDRS
ncbi:MAG: aromatic amino acid lyase, partial [Alphaproteobacteria bacterium]